MFEDNNFNYEWNENLTESEWDKFLSQLNGHPLQSAKWGNSRHLANKINDYRWAAFKNNAPVFIARFEERRVFKFFKIAWVPKGPIVADDENESVLYKQFLNRLKNQGYFLCAVNPWKQVEIIDDKYSAFYTIWIDLTLKKDKLWEGLHKQCRNDIKRAKKNGVLVEKSKSIEDLNKFYKMCELISKYKGFSLRSSKQLMLNLFTNNDEYVESTLFLAKHDSNICGGAFILRCGKNIHYFWGAVNRQYSHLCIGELLQWEIVEWASSCGLTKYDLEGLSSNQNGGVDKFKKKFGGTVIAYSNIQIYSLYMGRKFISWLIKKYLSFQHKNN
ncbi:MAG: hypothetical protein A3F12_04990 [Gammaproteobacteria bacterium RIFCSPHIGHO2_12_FULL_38_14]|nr:MAG: hypothetical protein A3F12_04990 [Gammaproteobacteria bacterium RIFCSPHIGHO2_12_FULL_38_14]